MPQIYTEFNRQEMSDGTYWIAKSNNRDVEDVRIETGWFDAEPGEKGKWEKVVGAIIQNDLTGDMDLHEGKGSIEREKAVKNLTKGDDAFAENEQVAQALLDYFESKSAITTENNGSDIVLLTNPSDLTDGESNADGKEEYRVLSWAAAIDACIDRMEETITEFEQAKDRLESRSTDVQEGETEAERLMKERGQELQTLGEGAGVPNPQELSDAERQRYNNLKEDFVYYKKLHEVEQENLGAVEQGIEKLVRNIEKLRAAKETYEDKRGQVRRWALSKQVFPEEAMDLPENMADLVTSLSGMESVSETAENMDPEELNNAVDDVVGVTEEAVEVADETVDTDLGEATDAMMMDQE